MFKGNSAMSEQLTPFATFTIFVFLVAEPIGLLFVIMTLETWNRIQSGEKIMFLRLDNVFLLILFYSTFYHLISTKLSAAAKHTLESGINIGVQLLIFGLFSRGYAEYKGWSTS